MVYGDLPYRDTDWFVPDVYIYYVSDVNNVLDTVSTFIHLPWVLLSTNIIFLNKGLDKIKMQWPPLYHIYILNLG